MVNPATGSPLLANALAYAARGWRIIPLYGLRRHQCLCSKGASCPSAGKHPPIPEWVQRATTDTQQIQQWWTQWPSANVGIVTGKDSGIAVVDMDPRHGGDVNLEELQLMYAALPDTPQVLTGGGGIHYYFACTEALPACDLAHGIQFQTEGRLVVAPPSHHASGQTYAWEVSHDPEDMSLAPLPDWIQALALSNHHDDTKRTQIPLPTELPDVLVNQLHISSRIKAVILTGVDPERPARYPSRSEAVFAVIQAMLHGGHDDATIAAVLLNPTYRISDKPLSQRDPSSPRYEDNTRLWVAKEIHRARTKFQPAPNGKASHVDLTGTNLPPESTPWRRLLLVKKNGDPTMNVANIGLILANHARWAGKFWWDSVRSVPMYEDAPLKDEFITEVAQWFGIEERLAIATTRPLRECIMAECHQHERDLLKEWLESLPPWDGVHRLNFWLHDVAEATNDAYGQAVACILPVSMVARALHPGSLYRSVIILEGPENTGKSSLVQALAGAGWYVELTASLENKESHMTIQGAWIAEMAELDSLSRTEETRLKAFITLREDSWVPKYSNFRISVPRRTILIGTTNEQSYLKGQTGNTRFLPLKTGRIDIAMFLDMREQLFAEAMVYYHAHQDTWWELSEEAQLTAAAQREDRRLTNVYEGPLAEWLAVGRFVGDYFRGNDRVTFVAHETSWQEIAQHFLKIERPEQWKDRALQQQISTALKALGWKNAVQWRHGAAQRVWTLPGNE